MDLNSIYEAIFKHLPPSFEKNLDQFLTPFYTFIRSIELRLEPIPRFSLILLLFISVIGNLIWGIRCWINFDITPLEIEILYFLHLHHGLNRTPSAMATNLEANPTKIDYYLKRLVDRGFVRKRTLLGELPDYSLDQKGREYLIKKKRI